MSTADMDFAGILAVLLGGSWASGIRLYATIAGLGIMHRMHLLTLPADSSVFANPLVIIVATLLAVVEFITDKIPYVDSIWDSIHTFIRPIGGAALGYLATAGVGPVVQLPVAILCGGAALEAHVAKATARVAINTSPEPVSNIATSTGEDALVLAILYFVARHPIIATIIVLILIAFTILLIWMLFKFVKKIFNFFFQKKDLSAEGKK
ncbi:MAG: DUF4126 domain-containing protein [Candidatus Omnitrophica bacterium]|nr:DUF4126 domain-containing protein [Candidatus Omnitrophota bacterium]